MKVYFPNLNGVRAIAALMVIVFHIEMIKDEYNITGSLSFLRNGGSLGVILFFVLSGFLITYLLIAEKQTSGDISIKDFYIRRILRIWPLYILVCVLGLFIVPLLGPFFYEPAYSEPTITNRVVVIILYFLFLSNILTGSDSHVNFLRPTWSVSVEEQFYLIWPLLMKKFFGHKPFILYFFSIYLIIKVLLAILSSVFFKVYFPNIPFETIYSTICHAPFDSLCIGGFAAVLLHRYNQGEYKMLMNLLFHKRFQQFLFCLIPFFIYVLHLKINLLFPPSVTFDITKTVFSLLFALAILNLAANLNVIISLENYVLRFLGKISYGLYLYHWFVIVLVLNILKQYNLVNNVTLYIGTLGLTICISAISYYLFELRFLKLKHRFSKIISGDFVKK